MTTTETVTFVLEGQHRQDLSWEKIGTYETENAALEKKLIYQNYVDSGTVHGWLAFRVVRVTTIREIL